MNITYSFFKDYPTTRILIQKMMNSSYPDIKTGYKVKKLVMSLSKEFEIFGDLLKDTEKVIEWEDGKVTNSDAVSKAFEDFYSHEFSIGVDPLGLEEVSYIKDVTPREIELLEMVSEPRIFDSLV